ncbi:MAG: S8 family serine peptidase, partial [Kiritimatiellae bacterium]|nr:S8 family serine peptidase [Kiritimatiellia bacterium]
ASKSVEHVFVAAAANDGNDNDGGNPAYPASYDLDNIIAVAATDANDGLAGFSNYGVTTVDLGAPGVGILSTTPTGGSDLYAPLYDLSDGTSMAAPHVAGAAAMIRAANATMGYAAVKARILETVDALPSLAGRVLTGGRLNLNNALPGGGAVVPTGDLVGYFTFNDFGVSAEDFTTTRDWITDWKHAAGLEGGSMFSSLVKVNVSADTDGDGLPDWWELAVGLNPNDNTDDNGAEGDPDGDGLTNLSEYLANTDPFAVDTDLDGISDAAEDSDGDGLANLDEQEIHGSDPGNADTDDDGVSDGDEVDWTVLVSSEDGRYRSSPVYSRSPLIQRSLQLDGSGVDMPTRQDGIDRFDSESWSLECWVMPTNGLQTGSLIERVTITRQTNYALRLVDNRPVIEFTTETGNRHFAGDEIAIPSGAWTYLAATWSPLNQVLSLYVNNVAYQAQAVSASPARGRGFITLGTGVHGLLDDVRIWDEVRSADEIESSYNHFGGFLQQITASSAQGYAVEVLQLALGDATIDGNNYMDGAAALGPPDAT